jgi:hypothetical protein
MRKFTLALAALALCAAFAAPSAAQDVIVIQPTIDAATANEMLGKGRKAVFEAGMKDHLTAEQSNAFWNVYAEYEKERSALDKSTMGVIKRYADQYSTMTNEQAMALTKEALKNQAAAVKIRDKYFSKMGKVIPGIAAARFAQVDMYLQSALTADMLDNLPLFGDRK